MTAPCLECGAALDALGRGRPRKFCLDCRPPKRALTAPREASEVSCEVCGNAFHTRAPSAAKYCSSACKWLRRRSLDGIPCSVCGEATGWTRRAGRESATCNPCRRATNPNYRPADMRARGFVHRWTCVECGLECERPATKGQPPKYCGTCRRVRHNPLIKIRHAERLAIYARDEWTCWLCEESVDGSLIGTHSEWRPSLDHVVPRSKGGGEDSDNLRLAHLWCNVVRSDGSRYTPEDFRVAA